MKKKIKKQKIYDHVSLKRNIQKSPTGCPLKIKKSDLLPLL